MKKLAVVVLSLALMFFASGSFAVETKDKDSVDKFTPYQEEQTDLTDNKTIPETVKDRIKELADTKPETKSGTVLPDVVRPSVNCQK